MNKDKTEIFICGCPRSGTSGFTQWLNRSPLFSIGMERYQRLWINKLALPNDAFTEERFFNVQKDDTWYESLAQFPKLYEKLNAEWAKSKFIGDKVPGFWRNLNGLLDVYSEAKIIFMHRDPFSIARSYKQRCLNPNDIHWGKGRDVAFAVMEYNKSIQKIVEFVNTDVNIKPRKFNPLYIMEYEKFFSNGFDRRGFSGFISNGLSIEDILHPPSPLLNDSKQTSVSLSDTEKDLIWSLLDADSNKEMKKIISHQEIYGKKRFASPKDLVIDVYHKQDRENGNLLYEEFKINGCPFLFRGHPHKNTIKSSQYIACIGSASTFGRFIKNPYPALLEESINIPCLNLGIGGARPENYFTYDALLSTLKNARAVVLELMSARGYPSAIFAPTNSRGNMGFYIDYFGLTIHRKDDPALNSILNACEVKSPQFIDKIYSTVFKYLSTDQRDLIRDQLIGHYLRDLSILVDAIDKPIIGLMMSSRNPKQVLRALRNPSSFSEWCGGYPHFVDRIPIAHLEQIGLEVIVPQEVSGVPFQIRNWEDGQLVDAFPWQSDKSLNTYYPSQEMHINAARLLSLSSTINLLQRQPT